MRNPASRLGAQDHLAQARCEWRAAGYADLSPLLIVDNAALGPVAGWIVIPLVLVFYVMLVIACLRRHKRADDDEVRV